MPRSFPSQLFFSFLRFRLHATILAIGLLSFKFAPSSAQQAMVKPSEIASASPYRDPLTLNFIDPEGPPLPPGAVARIGSQRFRHGAAISNLIYSPDGKWLASGSTENNQAKVVVWEEKTGKPIFTLSLKRQNEPRPFEVSRIYCMEFLKTNRHLVLVAADSIQIWDFVLQKRLLSVPILAGNERTDGLLDAALSPDAQNLVLLWFNGKLEVRSISDGRVLREAKIDFRQESSWKIRFFPGGTKFLLENHEQEPIPVLDWPSLKLRQMIKLPPTEMKPESKLGKIAGIVFTRNDDSIFIFFKGFQSHSVAFFVKFDLTTNQFFDRKTPHMPNHGMELFQNHAKVLWKQNSMHTIQNLDDPNLKLMEPVPARTWIKVAALSPNGNQMASTEDGEGEIEIVDLMTKQYHPHSSWAKELESVRFSPNSKSLILESYQGAPWIDWKTGKVERAGPTGRDSESDVPSIFSAEGKVQAFVVLPNKKTEEQVKIRVIQTETGKQIDLQLEPKKRIGRLMISGNGKKILNLVEAEWNGRIPTHADHDATVWDVEQRKVLRQFLISGNGLGMREFTLSFDGNTVIQSERHPNSQTCVVSVWSVESGREVGSWHYPTRWRPNFWRNCLAISPNNQFLAGGGGLELPDRTQKKSDKGSFWIWELSTGRVVQCLEGHDIFRAHKGPECAFSLDGRLIATGDDAGTIRLFETLTGKLMVTLEGHTSAVKPKFSPDGKWLVSTSADAPCYVWDLFPQKREMFDPMLIWSQLGSEDGEIAFRAFRAMVSHPAESFAMIAPRAKEERTDKKQAAKWLANLDADSFDEREEAEMMLTKIAGSIEPVLRKALNTPNPEVKKRLERILASIKGIDPEAMRRSRVSMALGVIGTEEAKKQLELWE